MYIYIYILLAHKCIQYILYFKYIYICICIYYLLINIFNIYYILSIYIHDGYLIINFMREKEREREFALLI